MTVTIENAASNDKPLEYWFKNLPNSYDGGKDFSS